MPLLNDGIINIRQNLLLLQILPQYPLNVLPLLPTLLPLALLSHPIAHRLHLSYSLPYSFYLLDFFLAIGGEDFARFLEALVRELSEGDFGGGG